MLLAIDTSIGTSVAVVDRGAGVLAERSSPDARGHAESIGSFIAECLEVSGIHRRQLSAVAIGMGPGPFTGLRVGIAAGRAFALGLGLPVMRVISHDAIAFERHLSGQTGPLTVMTDARRREIYMTTYSDADSDGLPQRIVGPALAKADSFATAVPSLSAAVSAAALAMLADRMLMLGRPFAGAEAIYLR